MSKKKAEEAPSAAETAKARLSATGRNDTCPCGSGKKYKKCHMLGDESVAAPPIAKPDPAEMIANGWRLFEQRRPGAAEKEFRAALLLAPGSAEAQVGIGMARLSAGDNDGARKELAEVVKAGEGMAADLRKKGTKDAFSKTEAQPYIRASHAMGCLAFDQDRFDDALADLERVYGIDEGTVGTEARLIAGKTLVKVGRPAEAVPILEVATKAEGAASRAQLGMGLAHFGAGNRKAAEAALGKALEENPHYGKALLGLVKSRTDRLTGAAPGSREEALIYAQTYGDVWNDEAKKFLEEVLDARAETGKASPPARESAESAP